MIDKCLKPGVTYVRMSTDEQTDSPGQQRTELPRLAEQHGFELIDEYFDPGISGDEIGKRPQFAKMLQDAQEGKFEAIFCWDQDRFGRFDSIRAGWVIEPLRQAGVKLITVGQGVIDWEDITNRMMYIIQQEGKHSFLRDLGRNVLRGQIAHADSGTFIKSAPLGMCRVFSDQHGNEIARAEWDEEYRKTKGWTVTLAVSARVHEVEAVRWAFATYANTECGLAQIACGLEERGILSREGTRMLAPRIKNMLTNKKYIGITEIGKYRKGKFYTMDAEGNIADARTVPKPNAQGRRAQAVKEIESHPPLIDRETFDRVQAKLLRRAKQHGRTRGNNDYLLTGLLRCGNCGQPMHGLKGGKHGEYAYYGTNNWATGHGVSYVIRADVIEPYLFKIVDELVCGDEAVAALERTIRDVAQSKGDGGDVSLLKRRLKEIEKKLERGQRNLMHVDGDNARAVGSMLAELSVEHSQTKSALESRKSGHTSASVLESRAMQNVLKLRERFRSGDTLQMRGVLHEIFESITLFFEGARQQRIVTKGVISFRPFM